ncbi:MAG: CHAT domain-containing protein, partial [Cyclobacteriaceae bacterium]|nr:CHAT domain-containing protein [Cyclobacteriaceae bacterium]
MRITNTVIIVLFVISSLHGQEWLTNYQQSLDHYQKQHYKEARAYAETSLSMFRAEVSEPHKNTASILRQLSLICFDSGDMDAAVAYSQEEVRTIDSLGIEYENLLPDALNNLGLIRNARSEYGAAAPLFATALEISQHDADESDEQIAIIKGNYAIALYHLKRDEEAEKFFSESVAMLEQLEELPFDYVNIRYTYASLCANQGKFALALDGFLILEQILYDEGDGIAYAGILIKSGDALDNLGRFSEAIGKYRSAIGELEQMGQSESPEYNIAQNNLALDFQKTGRFSEAMELGRQLMDKRKKDADSGPGAYVLTATNYAGLLMIAGEWEQAAELLQGISNMYKQNDALAKDLTYLLALQRKSEADMTLGYLNESLSAIETALTVSESEKLTSPQYGLYNQKAKILARQGRYQKARTEGTRALEMARASYGEESGQVTITKNTLAGIYTDLGMYGLAAELYLSCLTTVENTFGRKHVEYATVAANYSSLLQLTGDYFSSEHYLTQAVSIKKEVYGKENPDYLTTYENLALLYASTGRYGAAIEILEEVQATKESYLAANDPSLAYTYSNLGSVKKQVAAYAVAEEFFKKALAIYVINPGRQHIRYASTASNLALLYQKMGNTQAARPLLEEALKVYEDRVGKSSPDYATALVNLATLHQMDNDPDKAKDLLRQVLEIDEKLLGTDHPLYSKTLNNLAALYEQTEDYSQSKALYEKSLGIYQRIFGKKHPSYALTLYNLAVLEQALDELEQAKAHYLEVVSIRKEMLGTNHPDYTYSRYGLASIYQKTGEYERAKEHYSSVIDSYLQHIRNYFPALSESEKSAFYGKIKPVFDAYMDFAIEYVIREQGTATDRQQMLGQLFDLQLSTKALLLNASNKVRNRILSSGDTGLIRLFQDWIRLKEDIVKSYSLSRDEILTNNIDLPAMEAKANDMEKQLSLKSSLFAGQYEKEEISWQEVKAALKPTEAAVEIIRIRKNLKNDSILYAALLLENQPESIPNLILFSNGDELEDKGFRTYKNSILYKIKDKKTFGLFWAPIDQALSSSVRTVYLSADGIFNKVNISTLLDPQSNEYLISKYDIRLLSNTRELAEGPANVNPKLTAELFGFPTYNLTQIATEGDVALVDEEGMRYSFGDKVAELPGTLAELKNISSLMNQNAWTHTAYYEAEASEANIKKLQGPKIFHVATHGFFLEDIEMSDDENEGLSSRSQRFNPLMRSGLLLAGAENTIREEDIPGEEDGILTAYEAMNLNFDNTDLVVMSACET